MRANGCILVRKSNIGQTSMETDLICSPLIGADNELQNMSVQTQSNEALKGESAWRDENMKTRMMERKRQSLMLIK